MKLYERTRGMFTYYAHLSPTLRITQEYRWSLIKDNRVPLDFKNPVAEELRELKENREEVIGWMNRNKEKLVNKAKKSREKDENNKYDIEVKYDGEKFM